MASWPDYAVPNDFWDGAIHARLSRIAVSQPPTSETAPSYTIASMDAEDLAIQRALHVMRSRRNTLIPIHRLPPEILTRIFMLCAEHSRDVWQKTIGIQRTTIGWIAITYVCRRWRQLALGFAGLWTMVTFTLGERWAEEMLKRSQARPIVVKADMQVQLSKYELVAAHISHTRELNLGPLQFKPTPLLLSKELPAPLLEKLSLSYRAPTTTGPLDHLGTCAPALRYLEISTGGANIPWTAALLAQLVSLDVSCLESPGPRTRLPSCSMTDVLNALERMDGLESLRLVYALPLAPLRSNGQPAVFLSRLKSLKIDGIMDSTARFLEYVRATNCTKLCLALEIHHQPEDEIRDAFSRVTAWTHANCPFVPQAVRLTTLDHGKELWDMRVEAFRRVEDAPLAERGEMTEEEGDVCVTFEWNEGEEPEMEMYDLARMCYDAVASEQLQQLVLDVAEWHPLAWKDIASSAVALERLFVAGDTVWTFVPKLQQMMSSRTRRARPANHGDPRKQLIFPALKSLQLGNLLLDESVGPSGGRTYGGALCDWLHERNDEGCSLTDLTLFDCDGDDEMLHAVPGLVVHQKEREKEQALVEKLSMLMPQVRA